MAIHHFWLRSPRAQRPSQVHAATPVQEFSKPPIDTPQAPAETVVVRLKAGVYPQKMVPALRNALPYIVYSYREIAGENYQAVITSANDSEDHHAQSLHYVNQALDFRANNLPLAQAQVLRERLESRLKSHLGNGYRVFLENQGSSRQHLHLQWEAKEF